MVKLDFDTYEKTTGRNLDISVSVENCLMNEQTMLLIAVRDQYSDMSNDLLTPENLAGLNAKDKASQLKLANDLAIAANYINMAIKLL